MANNKYLVISIPETHMELLEVIKKNAVANKLTVSQYVRNLLYSTLADYEAKKSARMDDTGATRVMEQSL